jgi:hypothetical protein
VGGTRGDTPCDAANGLLSTNGLTISISDHCETQTGMSASSPPSTLKFASVESQYIVLICETASRLFLRGIPEAVIRKLAGLELLARERATDTSPSECLELSVEVIEKIGGDDGARTRDLRRDRPAF